MPRLISVTFALMAPFILGGWMLIQGASSAVAETDSVAGVLISDMVQGAEDARVTVVEYASFTCSHCASFHAGPFKQLKKNYIDTDKVKFVFREVYFDKGGVWSSLIARCGGQERFFGIATEIFKGQKDWPQNDVAVANALRKIGWEAGLSKDTVESCLSDSNKINALVEWFKDNTARDKISSTPSLIINGQKYGNMSYDKLAALIEEQLAK